MQTLKSKTVIMETIKHDIIRETNCCTISKVSGLTTVHEVAKAYWVLTLIVFNTGPFRRYTLRPTLLPLLETFSLPYWPFVSLTRCVWPPSFGNTRIPTFQKIIFDLLNKYLFPPVITGCKHIPPSEQPLQFQSEYFFEQTSYNCWCFESYKISYCK
jgi:hypothetical protein